MATSSKAPQRGDFRGVLSRLRTDASGNTLAMIAMATIPLAGMVGSAVDIGRSYLIKSRLQQACDSGVLAARRSMAGSTLDSNAITQGKAFFDVNFSNDTAGSTNVSFTLSPTPEGQVQGSAAARVPMSITRVFGTEYVDLSVSCDARLEISNTDVMLVLDVTGSMADCPDNSNCGSGPGSKIVGLRQAVMDFYDTVAAATSSDARFRLGFVPYSAAVNVGIDPATNAAILPANWMVSSHTYQSRVANMTTPGWSGTATFGGWTSETFGSNISNTNCTRYGANQSFSGYTPASGTNVATPNSNPNNAQAPATVYQMGEPTDDVRRVYERVTAAWGGGTRSCTRRWRPVTTDYTQNGRFGFTSWDYKPVSYNVSTYTGGTPVSVYTGSGAPSGNVAASGSYNMFDLVNTPGSTVVGQSTIYDGCVEERDTVAQTTYPTIPATAYDLDFLTTPFNDASRWKPMWQELVYDRTDTTWETNVTTSRSPNISSWCPTPSSKLAVRDRADVQTYVDSLVANGNTFHDLGMAWGARMISPTGIWGSENATAPNGKPISRHLIFMTDGVMVTPPNIYTPHGYEKLDRRVWGASGTPDQSGLVTRHNNRFVAMCQALRANNVTVWTVNFSTANQPTLVSCASDSGKAFNATDTATLRANFQAIASQIAALRLSG